MVASGGNESLSSVSTHAALHNAISGQSSHAVLEYANTRTKTETAKASAAKVAIAETERVGASNPLHPTKSQVWRCDLQVFEPTHLQEKEKDKDKNLHSKLHLMDDQQCERASSITK
jgi:hypothetical protein